MKDLSKLNKITVKNVINKELTIEDLLIIYKEFKFVFIGKDGKFNQVKKEF